ncbi:hypothetical protein RCG23_18220 [Neobacillus sp. PS3-34]|uniref:hypothetical protein n=1 Tax=Neobacillus sp. PS3-34 TaxID=3070678 RepID=UPI0027E03FD2|nr:hypothetical protein [Neobacillus sp. PS3-34]WML47378.1 hypothetical protein RCG23_18220 [Neobacillus sp. PS3-34]
MKLQFSKKEKLTITALTLLLIAFVAIAQFLFVQPLNTELQQKEQSLKTEQQLLSVVQQKKAGVKNSTVESTTELQEKLPVKPMVQQLILDLEKAEVVSNSSIKSMAFTKEQTQTVPADQQAAPANGTASSTTAGNTNTSTATATNTQQTQGSSNTQTAATPSDPNAQAALPPGVQKVTVNLSVESPSYQDLEKFISTLESQKRISVVEKIDFTGGKEITSLGQEEEPLIYTLTISAFYMPDLKDLQNQLPKLETPAPANKRNPLSNFADISPSDNEETQNN